MQRWLVTGNTKWLFGLLVLDLLCCMLALFQNQAVHTCCELLL
jgi:hypothetical protein